MNDDSADPTSNSMSSSVSSDVLIQPDGSTSGSEFDLSDLLAVLVVAVALVLVLGYVMYGMGPV